MSSPIDTRIAALAWYDAGCCVFPVRADGSKAPALTWKPFQRNRPLRTDINRWFADSRFGVAVVCGAVSGGLELLEVEGRAVADGTAAALVRAFERVGLGALWRSLVCAGYAERSPSGGLHVLYRIVDAPVGPNVRLAARLPTEQEAAASPRDRVKVLAETRGEGGYVVVAPSAGRVHPSGRPWVAVYGSVPGRIPLLRGEERDALFAVVRRFDTMPSPVPVQRSRSLAAAGSAPGDAFERVDWAELLVPAGWRLVRQSGRTRLWRRPGKEVGVSASTGHAADRDRLFVFSTSTPFESDRPITKFHAYAVLHHGGDHVRAARALRLSGFGTDAASAR